MGFDIISYVLSKKHTKEVTEDIEIQGGGGRCIAKTEEIDDGHVVTFEFIGEDGKKETSSITIKNGNDGIDGVSPIVETERVDGGVQINITNADGTNSTQTIYDVSSENIEALWENTTGKPFEDIDINDFTLDEDGNLHLSSTLFDGTNTDIVAIKKELIKKATIDDTSDSTTKTWSASQIKAELDKKSNASANHTHANQVDVLDKFSVDGGLAFNSDKILMESAYDKNGDGKIDVAEKADTLTDLKATIVELNYLQGVKKNIQAQIDALSSGVNFKGEFSDYATMVATITSPIKGDWVYVLLDETQGGQENTQYVYDGTTWIYGGGRTTVNDASETTKGVVQLAGDLCGTATSPQLTKITDAKTLGYIKSITIDEKGRVISLTEDTTLLSRIADLESRPQIYVSETRPETLKDGDFWVAK